MTQAEKEEMELLKKMVHQMTANMAEITKILYNDRIAISQMQQQLNRHETALMCHKDDIVELKNRE